MAVQLRGAQGDGEDLAGICGPPLKFDEERSLFDSLHGLIGSETSEFAERFREQWSSEVIKIITFARDHAKSQEDRNFKSEHIKGGDYSRASAAWRMVTGILTEDGAHPEVYNNIAEFCNYLIPTFEAVRKNSPMGSEQTERARDFCRKAASWWCLHNELLEGWFPNTLMI